jgi:hypothetical protein
LELAMTEREIQHAIRMTIGRGLGVVLWRNNTGQIMHEGRPLKFGLCVGSSDLIGLRPLVITPEHVGKTVAQFVAIEVKAERGRPTAEQEKFIELVRTKGGAAGVARSPREALLILEEGAL